MLGKISLFFNNIYPTDEKEPKRKHLTRHNVSIVVLKRSHAHCCEVLQRYVYCVKHFMPLNTTDIPVLPGVRYPSMSNIVVEAHGVVKLLSTVKTSKASGPDEIPCRVLRETAHEIAPILADIFNLSLIHI